MSRQQSRPQVTPPTLTRRNEYFLHRNGIDREVISADICRYLGNDALVRPGRWEDPQTGQVAEGYYITAYRELTKAMIEDLQRDSEEWDKERRGQTSTARYNTSGGSFVSRDATGAPARRLSNSPIGQYRLSKTHHDRQNYGPSEVEHQQHSFGTSSPIGSGVVTTNYDKQRLEDRRLFEEAQRRKDERVIYEEMQRQQHQQHNSNSGGHLGHQPQPSPQIYYHTGAHMTTPNAPPPDYSNDYPNEYAGNRMSAPAPPQQPIYASSAPAPAGYTATTYAPFPAQTASQTNGQPYPNMAPPASLVGRVSPATQGPQQSQGYATQGQQPYGNASISRSSVPPPAPPPSSGTNKRRSDLDDDRYPPTDRHARRR
ncbi:hypothetical protein ACRE_020690 [Hapsidospora chrysogenum ATCC 11550]|uniref:Uncharacterized protein n=1 Tax=Hapsidospora chrysogenum (strain ATCC 11550 / CBS 779.69 / DSM 880 / IAM 14645 / JCM 23072 / IMI 49137) TaxID=857340 RepID=A0A086TCK0_HAPC1|nr:hypothetical protein ACRE_020690 [Hapsidospora chrysogenum ATCC 11550]